MTFAAFWLGGMVALALGFWAEWRRETPARQVLEYAFEFNPILVAATVAFLWVCWPGFLVWNATREREGDE
jgi:putative copper export protein